MPEEIERKFLIDPKQVALPSSGHAIRQGYLPLSENSKTAVRVRIRDDEATLTVKGENTGAVRTEFEYAVPFDDAIAMLDTLCQRPLIEKTRYEMPFGDHLWEIDVFHGDNDGLVVAEIELTDENDQFELPNWLSEEVTHDPKYYNSNLLHNPYKSWNAT